MRVCVRVCVRVRMRVRARVCVVALKKAHLLCFETEKGPFCCLLCRTRDKNERGGGVVGGSEQQRRCLSTKIIEQTNDYN